MEHVKLNYANCLKDFVGEQGLTLEDLQNLQEKTTSARISIDALKQDGKLGFMEIPYTQAIARQISDTAKNLSPKFENFVVIGIGGSALGNIALQSGLRHQFWNYLPNSKRSGWLRLFVPDNVDPCLIGGLCDVLDFEKTVFNVISKSGTTAECLANFFVLKEMLKKKVGPKWKEHVIITTDASKGFLRELAVKEGIVSFVVPANVGGRFSVLSPVGLVSAAFTGIDIQKLLEGAKSMDEMCRNDDLLKNPAAMYAAIQYVFYWLKRPMSVMMPYSNALYGISDWYRQLWAESLGKKINKSGENIFVGPTPIKALGATDQHSQVQLYIEGPQDKIITFLSVDKFSKDVKIHCEAGHYLNGHTLNELLKAEEDATKLALTREQRPNLTISLPEINEFYMGELIYMLELATAYAGEFFDINAFDQPGVELGKVLTYALMGRPGFEDKKKEIEELASNSKSKGFLI